MEFLFSNINNFVFYLLAFVLIVASLSTILIRNPIYAVLFLMLAFFTSSAIWMTLYAEFLAIALVLVYVGAVMVLFLFVVMMVDIHQFDVIRRNRIPYVIVATFIGIMLLSVLVTMFYQQYHQYAISPEQIAQQSQFALTKSNTRELGKIIFTDYLYAFEVVGVILLLAIVAAVSLTLTGERKRKVQNASQQLAAQKRDRLRVVKMTAQEKIDPRVKISDEPPIAVVKDEATTQ